MMMYLTIPLSEFAVQVSESACEQILRQSMKSFYVNISVQKSTYPYWDERAKTASILECTSFQMDNRICLIVNDNMIVLERDQFIFDVHNDDVTFNIFVTLYGINDDREGFAQFVQPRRVMSVVEWIELYDEFRDSCVTDYLDLHNTQTDCR